MRKSVYRRNHSGKILIALIVLCIVVIIAGVTTFVMRSVMPEKAEEIPMAPLEKEASETLKTTTVTLGAAGNVMPHKPFLISPAYQKNGEYDFSSIFTFIDDTYHRFNFMTLNADTTFPGKEAGYSGSPAFRSPDSLADVMKENGIDLLQMANNQVYDGGAAGFMRTIDFLEERKIGYTGVRYAPEDKSYLIQEINEIKIGMINYVYETPREDQLTAVNGDSIDPAVAERLNSFKPEKPEAFYQEMKENIAAMKEDGAEFIIAYMHWGNEYQQLPSAWQEEMAQVLCNIGVDAIIGTHPYVVQPIDVFTGKDGEHKMLCAYSLGNHLSNQRKEFMPMLPGGQTEDGLILGLTVTKTPEKEVYLSGVEFTPTWVYRNANGPGYHILPLTDLENLENNTGLAGIAAEAEASYQRTESVLKGSREKFGKLMGFSRKDKKYEKTIDKLR